MLMINQEVIDIVNSRYEILDIIDLLKYDYQLDKLDQLLSKYNNYIFSKNQRILILHHDTDYYTTTTAIGFTIFNLFVLLNRYCLAQEHFIMFTNHYGIKDEIAYISRQICYADPLKVIYTSQWYDYPKINSSNTISYKTTTKNLFCCLNGINRAHRLLTLCYLKKYNLLNLGMVSYYFK